MPLHNCDYNKTTMYEIACNDKNINYKYFGHTTRLYCRRSQHKSNTKNRKDLLLYNIINNNGGWDNWTMTEIENYPCENSEQARIREKELCDAYHSLLNINSPFRSDDDFKIQKSIISKKSNIKCIERVKAQSDKYYIDNKNNPEYKALKKIHSDNYNKKNKELILERQRIRRLKQKLTKE